jgi:hypothetical protein
LLLGITCLSSFAEAFAPGKISGRASSALKSTTNSNDDTAYMLDSQISRRYLFTETLTAASIFATTVSLSTMSFPAFAAASPTSELDGYLYKIVRVREATQQERRLIQTGKFKDMQRANVKLAIKFMVQNYRLADCVVGASTYLSGGNTQQMKAIDVGQTAVQNLQTILEYFDTSDVENIKVSR